MRSVIARIDPIASVVECGRLFCNKHGPWWSHFTALISAGCCFSPEWFSSASSHINWPGNSNWNGYRSVTVMKTAHQIENSTKATHSSPTECRSVRDHRALSEWERSLMTANKQFQRPDSTDHEHSTNLVRFCFSFAALSVNKIFFEFCIVASEPRTKPRKTMETIRFFLWWLDS